MNNFTTARVVGVGSIRRLYNKQGKPRKNVWQLVVSFERDPITSKQKQATKTFHGTKVDAQKALEKFRQELEGGLIVDADKVRFDEYSDHWLEARKASGRFAPATLMNNESKIKRLKQYFGSTPLKKITPPMIRNYYIELSNLGLSETTGSQYSITISQIMEQAVEDGILLINPCKRVKAPRQRKSEKTIFLSKEQYASLMLKLMKKEETYSLQDDLTQPRLQRKISSCIAARLILVTGIRRGEALGLTWKHIDFNSAEIRIRHSLDMITGQPKLPKSESGIRDICVDSETVKMLANWKLRQKNYLNSIGLEQGNETPVFTREDGEHLTHSSLWHWWNSFTKDAGFEGLKMHDLRHTHASLLISGNLNMKALQSRLGHADISTTMNLYAHALREDDIIAAGIVEGLNPENERFE